MSSSPRVVARRNPARLLTLVALPVVLVLALLVSVPSAREAFIGRGAARMELPPGGLVDSAPNFGWTQGEFQVSHDGAAG